MLRIAVCDDNEETLKKGTDYINKWAEENSVDIKLYQFNNGDALLAKYATTRMDIVILDIIMPLLNGIDTAKEIRQRDNAVKILFLTSSPEFALDSYEVKAINYLLKPVLYEKICEVLNECVEMLNLDAKSTVIKSTSGFQKIYFHDIEFIESQNKKVIFYLKSGKNIASLEPLYVFENIFTINAGFFKSHRSYIVNLSSVDHFNSTQIVTKSGCKIPIARGYGKAFKQAYFSQMFQN